MPGTVEGLVAVARSFIPEAAGEKRRLLDQLDASDLDDPKALIACHDALLFLLAYPQTRELHAAAKRALDRVAAAAGTLAKRSRRARRGLEESGIAWSEIRVVLSYPGARWLATRHPKHAEIAFFGGDATPLASILGLAFGTLEETTLATERSSLELLKALAAGTGGTRLQWLVRELDRLPSSDPIRDHLFLSLEAFVLIEPRDGPLSRTFARGLPAAPFVHRRGLRRIVDPRRLLDRPLPAPRRLTERDRWRVIDAGRAVLAMIGRETEPIVECLPSGVQYLELERGFAIALFHLPPDRRPLDPHVGLVMFKNGLPIAYGGGWPFLRLCRIGIHIFAPYRGGESSYLFAQVLRVYRQRFGIRRFVAEPTQFGAGDPDGLTSGAFWFYHRFGFRPVDPAVRAVADAESDRMAFDRAYRSPRAVLRRLAGSDLELVLEGGDAPDARCDPADLSRAVSSWIARRFRGDRAEAERTAERDVMVALGVSDADGWPEEERDAFRSLCPLLAQVPDLPRWPPPARRRMVAAMRAKGRSDGMRYFELTRTHERFGQAMAGLSADTRSELESGQ